MNSNLLFTQVLKSIRTKFEVFTRNLGVKHVDNLNTTVLLQPLNVTLGPVEDLHFVRVCKHFVEFVQWPTGILIPVKTLVVLPFVEKLEYVHHLVTVVGTDLQQTRDARLGVTIMVFHIHSNELFFAQVLTHFFKLTTVVNEHELGRF